MSRSPHDDPGAIARDHAGPEHKEIFDFFLPDLS
jgi:hypothetical protein